MMSEESFREIIEINENMTKENNELKQEIERLKQINELLRAKNEFYQIEAQTDKTTGLYNKNAFQAQVENLSNVESCNILVVIDIDDFKFINDSFGHPEGDYVLNKLGQLLKESIRQSDLAGRFGGDEFILFLRKIDIHNAHDLLERILKKINTIKMPNNEILISTSIGFVEYDSTISYEENFKKADEALYYSKNHGKNQVNYYNPAINTNKKR